jgi:hypothetical protein
MCLCGLCIGRAFFIAATLILPSPQGTETWLPSCLLSNPASHHYWTWETLQLADRPTCHNYSLSWAWVSGQVVHTTGRPRTGSQSVRLGESHPAVGVTGQPTLTGGSAMPCRTSIAWWVGRNSERERDSP